MTTTIVMVLAVVAYVAFIVGLSKLLKANAARTSVPLEDARTEQIAIVPADLSVPLSRPRPHSHRLPRGHRSPIDLRGHR